MNKRTLWTFVKGDIIGFIEASYTKGIVINSDYITFCKTFTRTSNEEKIELSTFYLPEEQKNKIKNIMLKKTQVCINARGDVLGSPFKGDVLEAKYVLDIKELEG